LAVGGEIQPQGERDMQSYFEKVCSKARDMVRNEKGQGLVEYALILVLIAIVVIAALGTLGNKTNNVLSSVNTRINPPAQ
jgi:pilus assembly protein Flp/PilA